MMLADLKPDLCLSIRQPWAWLIVKGFKNIENRDWPTNVRGPIYIHASQGCTRDEWESCYWTVAEISQPLALVLPKLVDLPRGGIVGQANLLDCVTSHRSEWFFGQYGFVLDQAKPLPFIPCRGRLGFFPLPIFQEGK